MSISRRYEIKTSKQKKSRHGVRKTGISLRISETVCGCKAVTEEFTWNIASSFYIKWLVFLLHISELYFFTHFLRRHY